MRSIILICAIFLATTLRGQEEMVHELQDFSEVKVYNGLKVNLKNANEARAVVTGDNSEEVSFDVQEGILKVKMNLENIWKDDNTQIDLYFTNLDKIDSRQNASVRLEESFKAKEVVLEASEGGDIFAEIEVEDLYIKSLTGAEIEVRGKAAFQDVKIRAGGQYYARYLETDDIEISISAGGVADIYSTGNVKAKVRAGGTVNIYGKPTSIEEDTLFGGKVNRKN